MWCFSLQVFLWRLEKNVYFPVAERMKCGRTADCLFDSLYLSLLHSSLLSPICFLTHWQLASSPLAPVSMLALNMSTSLPPTPTCHAAAAAAVAAAAYTKACREEEPFCLLERKRESHFCVWLWLEDALRLWLSEHPGFVSSPTFSFLLLILPAGLMQGLIHNSVRSTLHPRSSSRLA